MKICTMHLTSHVLVFFWSSICVRSQDPSSGNFHTSATPQPCFMQIGDNPHISCAFLQARTEMNTVTPLPLHQSSAVTDSALTIVTTLSTPMDTTKSTAESTTTNPTTDPTSDSTTNPTTDPTSDSTTNPTTDPTSDSTTNPTTDPTSDSTTDPTSDSTTNPTTDPTSDSTTNPTTDPTSDSTTNPTTDPTSDSTTDPTSDSTTNPTTDPTNDSTTNPTNDSTTNPTTDSTIDPTANSTTHSANITDPTTNSTTDPTPLNDATATPKVHPSPNLPEIAKVRAPTPTQSPVKDTKIVYKNLKNGRNTSESTNCSFDPCVHLQNTCFNTPEPKCRCPGVSPGTHPPDSPLALKVTAVNQHVALVEWCAPLSPVIKYLLVVRHQGLALKNLSFGPAVRQAFISDLTEDAYHICVQAVNRAGPSGSRCAPVRMGFDLNKDVHLYSLLAVCGVLLMIVGILSVCLYKRCKKQPVENPHLTRLISIPNPAFFNL